MPIFTISSISVAPSCGSLPLAISNIVQPTAKRSARASIGSPATCSGDMYASVPMVTPSAVCIVRDLPSCIRAMPKSSTLRRPSGSTKRLSGLMSRWMMSDACAAASTSSSSSMRRSASCGSKGPRSRRVSSDSPSSSSITRNGAPSSVVSMSRIDTAPGCRKRLTACASCSKRAVRSLFSAISGWRILMASRRPILWRAT